MKNSVHTRDQRLVTITSGLLFLLALVMTLITSTQNTYIYWWGGLAALLTVISIKIRHAFKITPIFMALGLFVLILVLNTFLVNPVFHPEALYFACYFMVPFLFCRVLNRQTLLLCIKIVILVFVLLGLLGLYQYLTFDGYIIDMSGRASAVFHTPNTFASALNLVLIPLIVLRLTGQRSRYMDAVIYMLVFALLATLSRSGWLALTCALLIFVPVILTLKLIKLDKSNGKFLVTVLFIAVLFFIVHSLTDRTAPFQRTENTENTGATIKQVQSVSSIRHRVVLYEIAWNRIKQKPVIGHGLYNFQYFQARDKTREILKFGKTNFVHNDYLQYLLETGLLGLVALLMLIATIYYRVYRICQSNTEQQEKIVALAIATALAAYFGNALVDFPLFPPALLLLFGMLIGIIDRVDPYQTPLKLNSLLSQPLLLNRTLALLLILFLCLPAVGQFAYVQASKAVANQNIAGAFEWFDTAQQVAPYDHKYYYEEAKLWLKAVEYEQSQEAAVIADKLLATAVMHNPFEQQALLTRSKLHRDYSVLLEEAATTETVLNWQEQVLLWRPHDALAQTEYIKTLFVLERYQEAALKIKQWLVDYPENVMLKKFLSNTLK